MFSVPEAGAIMRIFLYSLFAAWEQWEQWELNRDKRSCAPTAVEQRGNDWEQI
jgi:hypothetical protein